MNLTTKAFGSGDRTHVGGMFLIGGDTANGGWHTVQSVVSCLSLGRLRRQDLHRRERQHDHYAHGLRRAVRLASDLIAEKVDGAADTFGGSNC